MAQVAIITASDSGIGKECALLLAQQGFDIGITWHSDEEGAKDTAREVVSHGVRAEIVQLDLGNLPEGALALEKLIQRLGRIDVLVNNAGTAFIGLLTDMTDADWDRILHTNLSSVFYCSRAAVPYMVAQKAGKIINISSMWGTSGASCEAAYSASKAGVNGLTKALAKELAPSNIQVNAIACGVIDTVMNAQLSEEERLMLMEEVPAGRFGTPEEVADLVLDLAQGHAYLTGQVIGLDGGFL